MLVSMNTGLLYDWNAHQNQIWKNENHIKYWHFHVIKSIIFFCFRGSNSSSHPSPTDKYSVTDSSSSAVRDDTHSEGSQVSPDSAPGHTTPGKLIHDGFVVNLISIITSYKAGRLLNLR